jgi:hypothetical protein
MKEGGELGWLRLTDKSDLVLTTLHVLQHQDRGIFGESHAIIPRKAITSVRLSWRRSRGLLVLGTILLVISMILTIGLIIEGRAWVEALTLSPLAMSFIQYGSLLGGIAVYVLFWFTKRNEIQIMAPTATLGGIPRSYEEADKFCALLVSELEDQSGATNKSKSEVPSRPKAADHEWRL